MSERDLGASTCSGCGAPRAIDSSTCKYCGSVFTSGPSAQPKPLQAPAIPVGPTDEARPWFRQIPGFRSGSLIKGVVGLCGYLTVAALFFGGIAANRWLAIFGLGLLLIALLITDGWGIRTWFPFISSANRATAIWAYVAIGAVMLTSCAAGVAGMAGAPPTPAVAEPTSNAAASPTHTVTPSPTATATPTATPSPRPTPKPTPPPTPVKASVAPPPPPPPPAATPNLCGAPSNPWHYNFCGGAVISSPPGTFCNYFSCISSFWNGSGYVVQCADNSYSKSGGTSGVCSRHGGYRQTLWAS